MTVTLSKPSISDMLNLKGFSMKLIDLTGKKFGRLTILSRAKTEKIKPYWNAICECGKETLCSGLDLRSGDKKSCGCLRQELLRIDIIGKKFGKLTVKKIGESRGKSTAEFWLCKCECGNDHTVSSQHLRLGQVKSCGCWFEKPEQVLLDEAKDRFFQNIEKTATCWIWKGVKIDGYGIMFHKKPVKSHRFSFEIHKGKIDKNKLICHHCDNPSCVNPEHLYQGTPKDNSQDAYSRNRMVVGEKHHYSKLKENQVKYILDCEERGIDLANKFNVSEDTISRIRNKKSWKNVSCSN